MFKNPNLPDWQKYPENTKRFLEGVGKDLSDEKKKLLTPITLTANKLTDLKGTFHKSVAKVGFYYTAPVFVRGISVQYRNSLYYVTSFHLLEDYDRWLQVNYGLKVPSELFEISDVEVKVIEENVVFRTGKCEQMSSAVVHTSVDSKAFGFKIKEEVFPYKKV
jgi:hypothetical protein